MNTAQTHLTIRRGSVQALMLVAVGALGLSLGRWVVPDATPATVTRTVEYSSSAVPSDVIQRKLAQMDARDAAYPVAVAGSAQRPSAADVIGVKFAQMDAQDSGGGPGTAATAAGPRDAGIVKVKFAQMDAQDSALSAR